MVLSLVLTGCGKATGGGWIPSASLVPGEKATFGFTVKCKNATLEGVPTAVFYEGQFQYDDHSADRRVRVHGDVEPNEFFNVPGATCQEVAAEQSLPMTEFRGRYRTQSGVVPSSTGEFTVRIADGGKPSSLDGDEIMVDFFGDDLLNGGFVYFNTGIVQGGNITIQ